MKKTKLLLCAFALGALCSCQSTEEKMHDRYVKMFEESYLFEDNHKLEFYNHCYDVYEYLLAIENDDEFLKAYEFVMGESEDYYEFKRELSNKEDALEGEENAIDNRLDAVEKRMEARAKYLNIK